MGFRTVQELALKHKAGRTERWAEGHSNHEWGFYGFCSKILEGGVGGGRSFERNP